MSENQRNTPLLSNAFQSAMNIPVARYETPQSLGVDPEETMLVGMHGTGVTSANTSKPIVGTTGFDPCLALIIYNPRTKTAVIGHEPYIDNNHFLGLLSQVRNRDDDPVHLHLMGAPLCTEKNFDPEESNAFSMWMLNALAISFEATPNLVVKTFDVYGKSKPSAVAIDTRNGSLIRGTNLHETSLEGENPGFLFDDWHYCEMPEDRHYWRTPSACGPA